MSQKVSNISIKHKDFDLLLRCETLDRNLYKVIKLLHDGGTLYTHTSGPNKQQKKKKKPPVKIGRPKKKLDEEEPQTKVIEYTLNYSKAFHLIWKSGYFIKHLGIQSQQLRNLAENTLVGKKNQLSSIIQTLKKKTQVLYYQTKNDDGKVIFLRKKLERLETIKNKVSKIWSSLNYELPEHERTLYAPPLTFFDENMFEQQKKRILTCMTSFLLSLDLKLLQQSIMFIQELQTGHCIVTLQQSYPSFKTFKVLLKIAITEKVYHQGMRQLMLAKEECYKRGLVFKVQRFRMCHQCKTIKFIENNKQKDHQCHLSEKTDSITDFPYGYQQICLMSNFSYISDYEETKKEIAEMNVQAKKFLNRDFKTYRHPYSQVFNSNCCRFYCEQCHTKVETKENLPQNEEDLKKGRHQVYSQAITEKLRKLQKCPFCRLRCKCDRCNSLGIFNRMLAVYQAIGGNFEHLLSKLLFLNLQAQELFFEYVTFEEDDQYDELERNSKGVTLTYQQSQAPLPDQIEKLENKMKNNGFTFQNEDSIDSNQIYPGLQKIFSDLLLEQAKNEVSCIKGQKESENGK